MWLRYAGVTSAYLEQPFTAEVPLLDVIVSGAAVENVSVHGQRLHAVLMAGFKRLAGADASLGPFGHLKHLRKEATTHLILVSWVGVRNGNADGVYRLLL